MGFANSCRGLPRVLVAAYQVIRVLIDRCVRDALVSYHAAATHRLESGGLLLGYRKGADLHVIGATYPSRWDRASRVLFQRSAKGHQRMAYDAWRQSGGTVDWIGEWHTHPGGIAAPSSIDLRSWSAIAAHRMAPMVFVILDDHRQYIGVHDPFKLHRLYIVEENSEAILYDYV